MDSVGSDTSYTPTAGGLVAAGKARWAPLWRDLNRPLGGTIYYDATAQRVVVSWLNVRNYSGTGTVTFQAQFWPNGTVHFVYQAVAENMGSEQSARMVAMKAATDNAGKIINELQLIYNKTRQAGITKELSEIVGGAAAV